MAKLDPKLATVRIAVKAKSGEKLEKIKATTAVVRQGWIRRKGLKFKKGTDFFFWQMPPGRHPLFLSAIDFYEKALFVDFVKGVNPLVIIILEPSHSASFRSFQKLSKQVRAIFDRSAQRTGGGSGEELYEALGSGRKAAALNILAKMQDTQFSVNSGATVIGAVDHIYKFQRDRIYVVVNRNLQAEIEKSLPEGRSRFRPASGVLHKNFPSGSYKTVEKDKLGNLQLSFNRRRKKQIKVDADIDIYTDYFRHFFGEVFWNNLADVKTNPFQVYGVLVQDGTLPEYELRP
ncbi:hypothetical protein MYX77_00900 [Acidobacteriia bacterium AH_259_A11_L15]|nr:hypothetical protein [Acidobacteriia bacterium AH_259_A11_L15]